ncbi:MAG TPA: porin family protein [Chryseosolibacter sp.]|nr:porin family protein [Chryseosolibacter sp.]
MKKVRNLSLLACAVAISMLSITNAQAQYARAGIKGGLNLSNLYVDQADDDKARIGWHAGFYGQLFASEAFAIQPEVVFSTKGTGVTQIDATSARYESKFNLQYIDIPILAVFKLGEVAEIHAGAYWAYLLGAEIKNNDRNPDNEFTTIDRDNFDDWDYGLVGGIGFNLGEGAQLGVRYNYGLNEIAESRGARRMFGNSKNQVAQLYFAVNLNSGPKGSATDNDY